MKKGIIFIMTLMFAALGNAQSDFGVRSSIGLTLAPNETTFVGEVFDFINHEVTYKGSNIVKSYGLFAQKKTGYLFARGEVSYTHFKQEYGVRSFVEFGQGARTFQESFGFIDTQILAGLTYKDFRIGVGPVAHVLVNKSSPLEEVISGYNENIRTLTWGFTTGVGIDAGRFSIDVRYENNFRTVGDHIYYGNRNAGYTAKPHVVNIGVGIRI